MSKIIFLADMESFYASVEIARNPSLKGKPVAVCGDPEHRHGIVLAASKEAKVYGVRTGMPARECRNLCPGIIFIKPRMKAYIETSLKITKIFEQFTDRVIPYSIDEQFLDMTGCAALFGTPVKMASLINKKVLSETGIRCRIGIGDNPLQAKMACDNFAKKNRDGIFKLNHRNYAEHMWPLPIKSLFGVGNRMEKNLQRIGIFTVGSLAAFPRETLKHRWGINGEILWLNARGIDYSTFSALPPCEHKAVGHSITLPRDYGSGEEIKVVLLELTEEVSRRARALGKAGKAAALYCRGADFDNPSGFFRQKKLAEPTAITTNIYPVILELFYTHWDGNPVRAVGVSLLKLVSGSSQVQLSLFEDREKTIALGRAMDTIRERFGHTSLFRASSLTPGAQLFERATKIGGHEA